MDERQGQVVSGAGLQDSRINEEFVAWLNKWGPRAIYALLIIVLGYLGWQRYEVWQQQQVDRAFEEYQAQLAAGNPDVLLQVAEEHDGKASVWTLATLDAADILLRSARTGVRPTASPTTARPDDLLGLEEQEQTMRRVASLYERVVERNSGREHRAPFTLNALWGLASAQLSLGENDAAQQTLERYVELAEANGFPDEAESGRKRLDVVNKLAAGPVKVYRTAELPEGAQPPSPVTTPAPTGQIDLSPGGVRGGEGGPLRVTPVDPSELPSSLDLRDRRPASEGEPALAEDPAGEPTPEPEPADEPE